MKTIQDFENDLDELINKKDYGDLTVRELVGALEITKSELLERSRIDYATH